MFLFQVYQYRVDKSRTNEFGYSYDHSIEKDHDQGGAIPNIEDANSPKESLGGASTIEKEKQQ